MVRSGGFRAQQDVANDSLTAARAAKQAFKLMPVEAVVQLVRAAAQWRQGNLPAAARSLHEILGVRPDDLEALCLLGEVHRAAGRPEAARRVFLEALSIDSTSAWAQQGVLAMEGAAENRPPITPGVGHIQAATDGARHRTVDRN